MGAVDRIFITVTKNMDKSLQGILPEKDMSRCMFYESLVRIADFKYRQTKLKPTTLEGIKELVNGVLKPRADDWIWMGWRKEKLWCLEIDDLYRTNLTAMQRLWKYYFLAKKRTLMLIEDAIELFTKEVELDLLPEQVSQCWGLSKMTVNNDIRQRHLYLQCSFVEFLEFFARVAKLKFDTGATKALSLQTWIEMLMDVMFPIVNMKRKEVVVEIEYQSVSEDELVEDKYFI